MRIVCTLLSFNWKIYTQSQLCRMKNVCDWLKLWCEFANRFRCLHFFLSSLSLFVSHTIHSLSTETNLHTHTEIVCRRVSMPRFDAKCLSIRVFFLPICLTNFTFRFYFCFLIWFSFSLFCITVFFFSPIFLLLSFILFVFYRSLDLCFWCFNFALPT